jgi:hypothetical protein
MSTGTVIELGCGLFSTPFLHWACRPTQRPLITYESKPEWIEFARQFERDDYHTVVLVEDWDKLEFDFPISVALVDHAPDERRRKEVAKLVEADYVVIHDAGNSHDRVYKLSTVLHLFKYRWKYNRVRPMTALWSNKHDIRRFNVR